MKDLPSTMSGTKQGLRSYSCYQKEGHLDFIKQGERNRNILKKIYFSISGPSTIYNDSFGKSASDVIFLSIIFSDIKLSSLLLSHVPLFCDPMACSLPSSSVHGISQARTLEWIAISVSRSSSWLRNRTCVSCIAGRFFTTEPPGKPHPGPVSQISYQHVIGNWRENKTNPRKTKDEKTKITKFKKQGKGPINYYDDFYCFVW